MGDGFGHTFRVTTWGESHGPAIGAVVEGCPAGLEISHEDIQQDLDRRRPGQSSVTTARKEEDTVQILSGVFEGTTTGTPISLMIPNKDADSSKYETLRKVYRPGHADYTYAKKYGIRDHRGGGRSSGRETAARVAAGAIARRFLHHHGLEVFAHARRIGDVQTDKDPDQDTIDDNMVRCADPESAPAMEEEIRKAKEDNDSIGGIVEVITRGCQAGLGNPVFDKLDAELAKAIMSIGAVKGVEIGSGFSAAAMRGSTHNDRMAEEGFKTNNAGGILGGISSGQDIVLRFAVKPTPSIARDQETVDTRGTTRNIRIDGRHDPCIVPRIIPVAEAMVALVLADAMLRRRGDRIGEDH